MSKKWQAQRERGNQLGLQILMWVALRLGRRSVFFLLCFVVFHYFLLAKSARTASCEFLTLALRRRPSWRETYLHLLHFAVVSVDRIYFLSGRESLFDVRVHGNEIFSRLKGRGCILLTSHLGSFDALRVMGMGRRELALPIRILLDVKHNPNAMKLIQSLDPELASGVIDARISPPELALMISEAIASGKLVGVMADRCVKGDRVVCCPFLGKPAFFPQGIWQLASVLEAPVIACFGIFRGGNRYELHFELISEQLGTKRSDRAAAIHAGINKYVDRLEHFARSNPFNWFNFYDFWKDDSTERH